MDYGLKLEYTTWEKKLQDKGYYHCREYYPFGRHSTMTNGTRTLIRYHGRWCSWEQVRRDLFDNWIPANSNDLNWFYQNVMGK